MEQYYGYDLGASAIPKKEEPLHVFHELSVSLPTGFNLEGHLDILEQSNVFVHAADDSVTIDKLNKAFNILLNGKVLIMDANCNFSVFKEVIRICKACDFFIGYKSNIGWKPDQITNVNTQHVLSKKTHT